jgi:hypothetical protein
MVEFRQSQNGFVPFWSRVHDRSSQEIRNQSVGFQRHHRVAIRTSQDASDFKNFDQLTSKVGVTSPLRDRKSVNDLDGVGF